MHILHSASQHKIKHNRNNSYDFSNHAVITPINLYFSGEIIFSIISLQIKEWNLGCTKTCQNQKFPNYSFKV